MPELFRIQGLLLDPATVSGIRRRMPSGTRLVFWPLALLTLVMLAIQLGAWQKEFNIAGPFRAETNPARHALVLAVPKESRTPWWSQPLRGDTNEKTSQSDLELRVDGHEMGPPHTLHETIREGKTAGFSHWGSYVLFSLPPGVQNAPETVATLRYSVLPRAWVMLALIISTAPLGWLLYDRPLTLFARRLQALVPIAIVLRVPYLILLGLCCAALIGSVVYVASSLYALATGWALPTTALIRWSPIATWAARNEPYLGHLLLTLAGVGAIATWLVGSNAEHEKSIYTNERMLRQLLFWCGFPIAACAYAFDLSAMWSGLVKPGDLDTVNIGGLVPFTDGSGYLASAFDQARDGVWNPWVMRRPLAAAFRSVLLFLGQYSFPQMLLLQACLLGAAAWAASYAVMVWRGVWAGVGFFGLIYIYARIFAPTSLTEPLGLFWALLSVPFFIDAFRSGAVKSAQVGFAMTVLALMTRMGNMFAIPALLLWLVWQFGHGIAAKARIGLVSIGILLGMFGLNSLITKAYGDGHGSTGSNFAYSICGLTLGSSWDGCPKKLEEEGTPTSSEDILIAKMYDMAWQNFQDQPGVFFHRLKDATIAFYTGFPETMLKGYGTQVDEPRWFLRTALVPILLIGIAFVTIRLSTWRERTFWFFLWASLTVSAGFVYFDDGTRVLAASHPLIVLFLAMGLANPRVQETQDRAPDHRLSLYGSVGLFLAATLFAGVPWISYRVSSGYAAAIPKGSAGEVLVFGGKRMSGFLVVSNGGPLRNDVPTIHMSDFEEIVAQSHLEDDYQGLLHPVAPPLPFGFVFAPRMEGGVLSDHQYIVPAEVMERRDVPAWRFKFEPWQHKPNLAGDYWVHVIEAAPWSP
jgi:hypothetical protein